MQRKPLILLMLLTMIAASRAATDHFDSFMGVDWICILALSPCLVIGRPGQGPIASGRNVSFRKSLARSTSSAEPFYVRAGPSVQ
jgi:hypothetical protein